MLIDEESIIGLPLSNYIKGKNTVIEIQKPYYNTKQGFKYETIKNMLCKKAKIKMIRILLNTDKPFEDCVTITRFNDSEEVLMEAINVAFQVMNNEIMA